MEPNAGSIKSGSRPRVLNNSNLSHGHKPRCVQGPFIGMLPFLPHIKPIKHMLLYPVYRSEDRVSNLWYQLIAQLCPTRFKFHLCQVSHKQLLIPALQLQLTHFPTFLPPSPGCLSHTSRIPSVPGQVPRAQLKNTESLWVPQDLFFLSILPTPKACYHF